MGNGFLFRDWEDSIKENNKMLSETQIREMVREGLKKALFESSEVQEEEVQEEEVQEEGCASTHEELEESELDERRKSADGAEASSHGRGREGEDVANSARLEEVHGAGHPVVDEMVAILDKHVADATEQGISEELTVESRLRDKNDFLFEKLSKMWTK